MDVYSDAISIVRSVEPVSTTIISSTSSATLSRQRARCSSSFLTIMQRLMVGIFDEAGKPSFSYFRERWIRNCSKYRWVGAVHEVIPPVGRLVYSDIAISHKKMRSGDPDRNLRIYRKLLAEGKTLDLRQQYYYGRELYYHKQYEEAVSEQPGQPEQQEQMEQLGQPEQQEQMEQLGQPGQQVLPVREQLFRLHQDFRLP